MKKGPVLQIVVTEKERDLLQEAAEDLGVSTSVLSLAAIYKSTYNLKRFDDLPIELFTRTEKTRRGARRRSPRVPSEV